MIITSTLHNHSTHCDGKSTLDEMVEAAIDLGLTDIGFSGHSYEPNDLQYSIKSETGYIADVLRVREKYAGKIRVWLGIEQDFYSTVADRASFDYVIGAVHYDLDEAGGYHTVDATPELFWEAADSLTGGDAMEIVRRYYSHVVRMAERDRPDVIAHFDLITKANKGNRLFNEDCDEYRELALAALERCAATGAVFEVNTGAIARGWRDRPYPAPFLLERILQLGARVTLSADCHDASKLLFGLYDAAELLKSIGFKTVAMWENGAFKDVPLD